MISSFFSLLFLGLAQRWRPAIDTHVYIKRRDSLQVRDFWESCRIVSKDGWAIPKKPMIQGNQGLFIGVSWFKHFLCILAHKQVIGTPNTSKFTSWPEASSTMRIFRRQGMWEMSVIFLCPFGSYTRCLCLVINITKLNLACGGMFLGLLYVSVWRIAHKQIPRVSSSFSCNDYSSDLSWACAQHTMKLIWSSLILIWTFMYQNMYNMLYSIYYADWFAL